MQLHQRPGHRVAARLQGGELDLQGRLGRIQHAEVAGQLRRARQAHGPLACRLAAQRRRRRVLQDHVGAVVAGDRLFVGPFVGAGLAQRLQRLGERDLGARPVERAVVAGQVVEGGGQARRAGRHRVDVARGLAPQRQGLTAQDLGARPGQRLIGQVQAVGGGGRVVDGGPQQGVVLQARAPAAEQVGADQPGLGGDRPGGGRAAGQGVERRDRGVEAGHGGPGGVGPASRHLSPRLDERQADIGQGGGEAAPGDAAGFAEGRSGGRVQAGIAEQFGPQQSGEPLLAAGAGPGVRAAGGIEGGACGLGGGGGLAQRHGVARAAGDFAPNHRGVEPALGLVLGADAAGGDVGRLGLLHEKVEIEQFQQGGVAAGQTVCEGLHPLAREQPDEFTTQLEHAATPASRRPGMRRRLRALDDNSKAGAAIVNKWLIS